MHASTQLPEPSQAIPAPHEVFAGWNSKSEQTPWVQVEVAKQREGVQVMSAQASMHVPAEHSPLGWEAQCVSFGEVGYEQTPSRQVAPSAVWHSSGEEQLVKAHASTQLPEPSHAMPSPHEVLVGEGVVSEQTPCEQVEVAKHVEGVQVMSAQVSTHVPAKHSPLGCEAQCLPSNEVGYKHTPSRHVALTVVSHSFGEEHVM